MVENEEVNRLTQGNWEENMEKPVDIVDKIIPEKIKEKLEK